MALVRILVDGYSLLHAWPALAPGKPRHSELAREELINRLTSYFDAVGTPITLVFDGAQNPADSRLQVDDCPVEVIYSRAGQTADQVIERVAQKLRSYGEFLVVTNDRMERETVNSFSGHTTSCEQFVLTVEQTLADMEREIQAINRRENQKFASNG